MVFTLPENLYATDPNFTTLFRLLDDFNSYSREVQNDEKEERPHGRHRRGPRPRFDIRETKDAYELYGEMPGVDRKDIYIELSSENILQVRGHVERPYDVPLPGKEKKKQPEENGGPAEAKKGEAAAAKEKEANANDGVRFLQRERFVGDFERQFAFPGPLQELDISASLDNGILKIVAPKQQVSKGRKIEVK